LLVQPDKEFDDPALKRAVCRCWACDCASEQLRKRVAALVGDANWDANRDDNRMVIGARRSAMRASWFLWPLAAAAILVISVVLFNRSRAGSTGNTIAVAALPVSLETNLIRTHDHCCKLESHQGLRVPKDDDAAIVAAMHARLNQPVLMFHPADSAWNFRGAAICRVGDTPTGHLVFAKGADALSIFSLPKSLLPGACEGSEYKATVDQHCIVAFIKDGALFCAVESGPAGTVSVDQLDQMAQGMKPAVSVAAGPEGAPAGIVVAELLRPIGQ
jgi:hypothetical protein